MAKKSIRKIRRQRASKRAAVANQREQNKRYSVPRSASMSKNDRKAFISGISRDGKIDKKEGQQAASYGIGLHKIRNHNINNFHNATRDFNSNLMVRNRNPGADPPTFSPLKYKRGAIEAQMYGGVPNRDPRNTDRRDKRDRRNRRRRRNRKNGQVVEEVAPTVEEPTVEEPPITEPTPEYEMQMPDVSGVADQLQDLRDELAQGMQMPEDPRNRRYVLGIRTKRGKRNRQGARGTFGRSSKRVKGLQSTSINL